MIRKTSRLLVASLLLMWGTASMAQHRQPFTFAQVTDVHFNSGDPKPCEYLKSVIADINANPSIDFVLVTGDLADNGDNASLDLFARTIATLNKKYYVIPGNHETTWSESGMMQFSRLFGSERFEFTHKGVLFLGFNTGPFIKMALGHVAPQDLDWVRSEVSAKGGGKDVFIVTHYPILQGDVDNWYQVTDSLRRLGVKVLIGGHYHTNRALSYDGIPGFLSRSTLMDPEGKVGYSIYNVTADSLLISEKNVGEEPRRWGGISLSHSYYDPSGHADKYPDFSVNDRYASQVSEVWRVKSGASTYASAAVDKRGVYVGDATGRMTCYDKATGKVRWTFSAEGKIVGTPAVSHGVLVFGTTADAVVGLDAATGRLRWRVSTDGPVMGAVAIDGTTAFVGGSDHKMRAIDIRSGREVWTYGGVGGYVVTRPLVSGGKVVFGAWDCTLYALNRQTGALMWRWTHPLGGMHYSPAGVWPVANGRGIYIADPQRALTAISPTDGTTRWRTFQSKVRESIGMSLDGQRIMAKTMQDSIVCYRADPDGVKELWATNAGFGYEHATTMLPVERHTVYSSTKEGLVVAIDDRTGRLLWEYKVGNSLVNTVTPAGGGRVVTTSTDGDVVMLRGKE